MNILSNPFSLPTAFDERAVRATIKKANLGIVQFGKNAQLSPEAINRFAASVNEMVRRSVMAGAGVASLSVKPTVSGLVATIPIQYLNLLGQSVLFSYASTPIGSADVAFSHDFTSGFPDGQYAIVIEWCEAPTVPSSTNGLPPTAIAGQNNNRNKIDNSTLYTAGNLTRTDAGDGTADAALRLNTSVQAIRGTQVQYNTRVIADATLVGLAATLASGNFVAAPSDEPNLVRLDLPSDYLSTTPRTTNGYVYAAKLCVVVKSSGSLTVYTGDNIPVSLVVVQRPMLVAPTRDLLQKQINDVAQVADTVTNALSAHLIDASDAHDATAISTATILGINGSAPSQVQQVLGELRTQIAAVETVNASQITDINGLKTNRYFPVTPGTTPTLEVYSLNSGMAGPLLIDGVSSGGCTTIGPGGQAGTHTFGGTGSGAGIIWTALDSAIPANATRIRLRLSVGTNNSNNGLKIFLAAPTSIPNLLSLPYHALRQHGLDFAALRDVSASGSIDVAISRVSGSPIFQGGLYLSAGVNSGALTDEVVEWRMSLEGYYV